MPSFVKRKCLRLAKRRHFLLNYIWCLIICCNIWLIIRNNDREGRDYDQ